MQFFWFYTNAFRRDWVLRGSRYCYLNFFLINSFDFLTQQQIQGLSTSLQSQHPAPPAPSPKPRSPSPSHQPSDTQQPSPVGNHQYHRYSFILFNYYLAVVLQLCSRGSKYSTLFVLVCFRQRMKRCLRKFDGCVWKEAVCSRRLKFWSNSNRAPSLPWRRYCITTDAQNSDFIHWIQICATFVRLSWVLSASLCRVPAL